MALYLTKNGEQLGPYTLDEVQALVRSGTVAENEWAWQEGLPNWIPLNQIPGYVSPPSALPAPPAPVATPVAYEEYKPVPIPAPKKNFFQKIGSGIVALAVAAFKFKTFAYAGIKTGLSLFLMIWAYSWIFGWKFAAGIVFMILVHELGHVMAAIWLKIPVSGMLFIPFVGALTLTKRIQSDAWTEARVASGGPIAGCLGSWLCFFAGVQMNSPWLIAIASVSFIINLFNLIPVPPFDGGGICAAISPWFWIVGLALLVTSLFYFHSWITVLILTVIIVLFALPRIKQTVFEEPSQEMQAYYNTHLSNRLIMALIYLGVFGALIVGYADASMHLAYLWETSNS